MKRGNDKIVIERKEVEEWKWKCFWRREMAMKTFPSPFDSLNKHKKRVSVRSTPMVENATIKVCQQSSVFSLLA